MRDDCVFCDIGKIRTGPIERWHSLGADQETCLVFPPLKPVTPGHVIVVPRTHAKDAVEDPELTGKVMQVASAVARMYDSANLITNIGRPATQSVFHFHVHVVPRQRGDGLRLPWSRW